MKRESSSGVEIPPLAHVALIHEHPKLAEREAVVRREDEEGVLQLGTARCDDRGDGGAR